MVGMMVRCKHYWSYEHSVWQGRNDNEIGVVRWCEHCGKKQMAFTSKWKAPPSSYDLSTIGISPFDEKRSCF